MRDQILAWPGPAREMIQGDTITRRYAAGPEMLRTVPAMRLFMRDRRWQGLARYIASFDVEPLLYVQSLLSHRRDAPPDPQTHLHADTFHPTMKAWLLLEDVGPEDGPLTYVAGSHRLSEARVAWERRRSLEVHGEGEYLSTRGSFRIDPGELAALAVMAEDGLVDIQPGTIRVREPGRMFLRQICMCFDRYVARADHGMRYSRAI